MREVGFPRLALTSRLRASELVASVLEIPLDEVPQPVRAADPAGDPIVSRWLAGFSLGLVPVAGVRPGACPH